MLILSEMTLICMCVSVAENHLCCATGGRFSEEFPEGKAGMLSPIVSKSVCSYLPYLFSRSMQISLFLPTFPV